MKAESARRRVKEHQEKAAERNETNGVEPEEGQTDAPTTTRTTTTTTSFHTSVSLFVRDLSSEDFMWAAEGAAHAGAAKRRRERRHRANLKYVRMSVAMALSECKHHTSRDQRMDRDGEWERAVPHGHVPEHPIPQCGRH